VKNNGSNWPKVAFLRSRGNPSESKRVQEQNFFGELNGKLRGMRAMEHENRRRKRMHADLDMQSD
jgi:hypothetical protein